MNVYTHPHLALLWAVMILAELWLMARVKMPTLFGFYCAATAARGGVLFFCSAFGHGLAYYYCFWYGQGILHSLVLALVALYAYHILGRESRLPRSTITNGALVLALLILIIVAACYFREGPSDSQTVLVAEQMAEGVLCLALWVVMLAGFTAMAIRNIATETCIIAGLCVIYSASFMTANVRMFAELQREQLWAIDMAVQLAAVVWWIWSVRKDRKCLT